MLLATCLLLTLSTSMRVSGKNTAAYREFVRDNLKKHGGNMSAVAAAYRQQGGGKRPASQAANRAKKKPALGLLHRKNPLQGELPERAAPRAGKA
jgi:hypothetical protein